MADAVAVDPNLPVSHEQDGRILTGVGTTVEALAATMERHSPEDVPVDVPPAVGDAPPVPLPSPKKSKGPQRFFELTEEREAARREAAEAKARAETLERELTELRAKPAAPVAPVATPPATPAAADFTYPTYDVALAQNPSLAWEDWVTDRARAAAQWELKHVDLDAQIKSRIDADWSARAAAHELEQVNVRGRASYADFDAVVKAPHMNTPWPPEKINAINGMGSPEHLKYALAKNPVLAEELRTEPNLIQFAMKLSSLLPQRAASPASAPASVVVPAPYQPVGSGSTTTAVPSSELPKRAGFDFDKSGYRERRAAERGLRR